MALDAIRCDVAGHSSVDAPPVIADGARVQGEKNKGVFAAPKKIKKFLQKGVDRKSTPCYDCSVARVHWTQKTKQEANTMFDCNRVSSVKKYRYDGHEYLRVRFQPGYMFDISVASAYSDMDWCNRKGETIIDGVVTDPDGRQYAIRHNAECTLVCATPV